MGILKYVPRRDGAHRAVKIDNSLNEMGYALASRLGDSPEQAIRRRRAAGDPKAVPTGSDGKKLTSKKPKQN